MQMLDAPESVAVDVDDYVARAVRLANDPAARLALRRKIACNKHRLYRDRAPVAALEDFLERAVRGS
jgi:predicted O-linked N-acetylglucosamine transferase (SPINDLY family)